MASLVVFDYDWSLINDNSDTFVFKVLQPELLDHLKQLTAAGVQWTAAIDQTLSRLSTSRAQLVETIAQVPVQPGMLEAVHHAHAQGADIMIVSDANTVFIESFLELHNLQHIVRPVYTNPAAFEGDVLHVRPYHSPPPGCPKCPVNMCKGAILRDIKAQKSYAKVVYIGDGGGDFCPTSELSRNDFALARADYELAKRLAAAPDLPVNVRSWSTGQDILALFQELL
ncbi:pyridoxal phosphate phosphatase [Achlya hypogyna]|uniref:Pyridoxal phosphate phosphatase n=1 Tax=Achlya hypogyna TaxID=1202772 RepID=A0A1V9YZ37_ACHHY|nr:pyridoxal phosphate phosphatase [Achlya hypogyna]